MGLLIRNMIPNAHVTDALSCILPLREPSWIAVVRGIDSTRSIEDLTKTLEASSIPYEVVNNNICVSMDAIQKSLDVRLLRGFDEIWVFSSSTPTINLSHLPSATSDAADFSLEIPNELDKAVKEGVLVILGDGLGLNYLTQDQRIHGKIARLENS